MKRFLLLIALLPGCDFEPEGPEQPVLHPERFATEITSIQQKQYGMPGADVITLTYDGRKHVFLRSFSGPNGIHTIKIGDYPIK